MEVRWLLSAVQVEYESQGVIQIPADSQRKFTKTWTKTKLVQNPRAELRSGTRLKWNEDPKFNKNQDVVTYPLKMSFLSVFYSENENEIIT